MTSFEIKLECKMAIDPSDVGDAALLSLRLLLDCVTNVLQSRIWRFAKVSTVIFSVNNVFENMILDSVEDSIIADRRTIDFRRTGKRIYTISVDNSFRFVNIWFLRSKALWFGCGIRLRGFHFKRWVRVFISVTVVSF